MTSAFLNNTELQPLIPVIVGMIQARFPNLQGLYLFGSVALGQDNTESDLDLAVLFPRAVDPVMLWECAEEIGGLVKRHVDLVDLQSASTVMRMQVIQTGQRVFTVDEAACQNFEMVALSMYVRFNEERQEIIEAIQQDKRVFG